MKLITRNTDYALRALCHLAKQGKVMTAPELVRALGVPRPFMRKILQRLSQEKILKSYKGQRGGFKLNKPAKEIYLMRIMRIFQGNVGLNGCFLKKDICPNKGRCVLRKKIHAIEASVFKQAREINIAVLI